MTKAEILKIVQMIGDCDYDLLCDNTVVMTHNTKYPIGFIKIDETEYAVQLKPATINTDNMHGGKKFTTLYTPLSSVEYIRARNEPNEAASLLNVLKQAGAFTEEEVKSMLNNKELFGVYVRKI